MLDRQTTFPHVPPPIDIVQAQCDVFATAAACASPSTDASQMISGRTISSFADLAAIYSTVTTLAPSLASSHSSQTFTRACSWNSVSQTCEYRCNHVYETLPSATSSSHATISQALTVSFGHSNKNLLDAGSVLPSLVFQQYGAGCTAFNIAPQANGNKACTICEDPNFNPPECSTATKFPDCMTVCNMLPNCTSLCTNILFGASPANVTSSMAERSSIEYRMSQGLDAFTADMQCCQQRKLASKSSSACAYELCFFEQFAANKSNGRDMWVDQTLVTAMAQDCSGGTCSVLGAVVTSSDGLLGSAMENNAVSAETPTLRADLFWNITMPQLRFDALLTSATVEAATGLVTIFPQTVRVDAFSFQSYVKNCTTSDPCNLQIGVLQQVLQTKYNILYLGLVASGRSEDVVSLLLTREDALSRWQETIPDVFPQVEGSMVPPFEPSPANLPLASAIDHFYSRRAVRRRVYGDSLEKEFGLDVGIKRVADCNATAGEGCFYPSGARQYDIARKPCRPMSLFRPQERDSLHIVGPHGGISWTCRWADLMVGIVGRVRPVVVLLQEGRGAGEAPQI
ncbi:hypothetical protein GUITHDRAFT_141788 [Guillardia theta CCMP2712]|uniref:Uncharacterized protein n=1 Tax=Guillardia theta (strain CCMP2712) TaxID=905079 RepID=L1J0J4_GUITC|nr:hypothetical protein GUITHDRAFT_141788 [Guillardia theta CCMP2712]EKX41807.1 hypothetical protein GUITHDRAFT_141788 [Guillardia theta CCMP2712]|eukprot:XP_005828787.1 hypothetical protein GUITHDRAFT_141788 [Guillardia theta CCMP2712]